ncbi:hypothetical protein [Spiroplasma ixodetis]|nr:hypothetical protein [Spiroplasma ixodetis]
MNDNLVYFDIKLGFSPFMYYFKFYHINAEKSLYTDFSPHF